jgi:hypothetical protein
VRRRFVAAMGLGYSSSKARHQAAARVRQFMRTLDAMETDALKRAQDARRGKKWINRLLVLQHIPLLKDKDRLRRPRAPL